MTDPAFLWETEALRRADSKSPRPPQPPTGGWVTLRQAEQLAGVPVATMRGWVRSGVVRSLLAETPDGKRRLVDLGEVETRARRRGSPRAPAVSPTGEAESTAVTPGVAETRPTTPPGTMLIPIDAWERMLQQLGNLHEAGQALAEARERAARAETEAAFLRERLAELRQGPVETAPAPSVEPASSRQPMLARAVWRVVFGRRR